MVVEEYVRKDGACPFRSWFDGLDVQAAVKVATAIVRLEIGNLSSVGRIGGNLGEYRIDWGPGDRLYLEGRGRADHPVRRRNQEAAAGRVQEAKGRQGQEIEQWR